MIRHILFAASALGVIACSGPNARVDYVPVASQLSLRANVGSVMVRQVSLPLYAAAEEVAVETAPGIIGLAENTLWADEPERAVTLSITRDLGDILNVNVGPDPWPFVGLPDVAVDIRVARMLAGADGIFRLSGTAFVGGDGIDYRNQTVDFDVNEPIVGEGAIAIAQAQSRALLDLSEQIARTLGR